MKKGRYTCGSTGFGVGAQEVATGVAPFAPVPGLVRWPPHMVELRSLQQPSLQSGHLVVAITLQHQKWHKTKRQGVQRLHKRKQT